jgi:hypothetical protein
MNSRTLGLRVAGTIFGIVAVIHLARLVMRFEVVFAGSLLPLWVNGVGVVLTAALCIWLWRLSCRSDR